MKKRLAAVLANRAGAYYDSVRTKTAPEGERRQLTLAARDDLRDAAFFDPDNEVIQSTLEHVEKTIHDLPDEMTAPVIEQASSAAESGGWERAFEVLRSNIFTGVRPPPTAVSAALADLLRRRAEQVETKERIYLHFEACLLMPDNPTLQSELERTIHEYARDSENAEAVETALTLSLVHSQKGEWAEAVEAVSGSFPIVANMVKLSRNRELTAKFASMAGADVFNELPVIGCAVNEKDGPLADVRLVEALQDVVDRAIADSSHRPLRDELAKALDLSNILGKAFEASDQQDYQLCDELITKSSVTVDTLADKAIKGVRQVLLLHRVDQLLASLRDGERPMVSKATCS